jgi:hypothetical protein
MLNRDNSTREWTWHPDLCRGRFTIHLTELDRAGQCCAPQKISSTTIHAGYFTLLSEF